MEGEADGFPVPVPRVWEMLWLQPPHLGALLGGMASSKKSLPCDIEV